MSKVARSLMLVTLGPVQEFLAQARRTRDLWAGSALLSRLSKAAIDKILECDGELVFPARDPEVEDKTSRSTLNVPNRILALVPSSDASQTARSIQRVVKEELRQAGDEIRKDCAAAVAPEIDEVWDEQLDQAIEVYAAWKPCPLGSFGSVRKDVEEAIGSRKLLREFKQFRHQGKGAPKSSLDGARRTVLREREDATDDQTKVLRRLRIAPGEQLDALGLIKRATRGSEQFVPLANIAVAAWVDAARARTGDRETHPLDRFVAACKGARVSSIHRPDLEWVSRFPCDAQVLFPSRLESMQEEGGLSISNVADLKAGSTPAERWGKTYVEPLIEHFGQPNPYVACLIGDGDHLGKALASLDKETLQAASRELLSFSREARDIVEQRHRGSLVYAGGDDVLAFVCPADVVSCAEELKAAYIRCCQRANLRIPTDNGTVEPTFSVGIGIGHFLENMGELLELGRAAARLAKGNDLPIDERRDALAIILDKRSGDQTQWRERWRHGSPADRLAKDLVLLEERLSLRKIQEVRAQERLYPRASDVPKDEKVAWTRLIKLDTERTLARASREDGGAAIQTRLTPEECGLVLEDEDSTPLYGETLERVRKWTRRLLIAKVLMESGARPQRPAQ